MHFAWVLRDAFSAERDSINEDNWEIFINKWVKVLNLEEWAKDLKWWTAKIGKKKTLGIVHPCQKTIGWTETNLKNKTKDIVKINTLIQKRMVMNTECDCFIQTPKRLMIIECKDKTNPKKEQQERHKELIEAFKILLPRENKTIYIELTNEETGEWNWIKINEF